jgi:hypothetical protein
MPSCRALPGMMNAAARGPVRHADPQRMKETT